MVKETTIKTTYASLNISRQYLTLREEFSQTNVI